MPTRRSRSRASAWEWCQVALVTVNAWWTTLRLGGYSADTVVITSALTGLLLVMHLLGWAAGWQVKKETLAETDGRERSGESDEKQGEIRRIYRRVHPAGWWLLPFLVYAAVNAARVTPTPWLGWEDWLGWAQMISVFWVVLNGVRSSTARATLLGALLLLAGTAAALACYQRLADPAWLMMGKRQAPQFVGRASGPFGNPNSQAALLLLLLPVAGALTVQRGESAVQRVALGSLTVVLGTGLALTISRGAWIGLALALTMWPLLATGKRWRWRVGVAGLVVGALSAVVSLLYSTNLTVHHRLDRLVEDMGEKSRPVMWEAAWKLFRERPWFGSGAGSFQVLFEKYRPEYFQTDPHWAHNDYLNTLSDYGLTGFILLFGAVGVIAWFSWRSAMGAGDERKEDLFLVRAAVIGLIAFSLHLFVDFHLKLPALALVFSVVAALTVQRARPLRGRVGTPKRWTQVVAALSAGAVAVMVLIFVLPHYRAERERVASRQEIDRSASEELSTSDQRSLGERALVRFAQATEIDSSNAQAWADRALAVALRSRLDPGHEAELGREAEIYARRALVGSVVIAEFWVRLGVALDMQGRWVEAGAAFTESLRLAPLKAESWFYHAYHVALRTDLYEMRQIAESEVAISLRLDPRNREAEALRRRLKVGP